MIQIIKTLSYKLSFLYALTIIILISGSALPAGGKITGRVLDAETKEPLPGVNVVITHQIMSIQDTIKMQQSIGAATDVNGYYFIMNVPPGEYNVRASLIGYSSLTQTGVRVDPDRTIPLDFEISSTALEVDEVVVVAQRDLIKRDVSGTQEIILSTRLEMMPILRIDEFVGKLKGIELVSGEQGNGLSIRGGTIRETDIRLDGMSLQDPRSGSSYLSFNSTTVGEIQILTGGFEARYGGIRSGLLNVITKEGSRDKYSVSIKTDIAPANQQRFFGINPWSDDSWIYRVYTGEYAFTGVPAGDTIVPVEFRDFRGWSRTNPNEIRGLDSLQKLELFKLQHPQYSFRDKPDYYIEGSITGPLPGDFIPLIGEYLERTTFLLGFKYEESQFAFPLGPRDSYVDWNGQLKLTTRLKNNMRISFNGMLSHTKSISGGATANYGGALVDIASSFSFLNNSESSIAQQGRLINGSSIDQIFNRSRLQYYDQRYIVTGAKFTHTINPTTFYTLDLQIGYSDQELQPFRMDTSRIDHYAVFTDTLGRERKYYVPNYGSPNASTNFGNDAIGFFRTFGGLQRIDSSYSYVYQLKGDITSQLNRYNQFEAGFSIRMHDMFVYAGTWLQSQLAFTPDTWQYYKATPIDIGLYAQDKLEFEGMILNLGLRMDYLNPLKNGYETGFPADADYRALYNEIYANLPGDAQSYERWLAFRELLDNPPGWPQKEREVQIYLSPRLGVSFPVTESSKLYFNYGHFYQRPPSAIMYNTKVDISSVALPTPELRMARTVQYEFGYEQLILSDFLLNVTAYYKDISNEPLSRIYMNYYGDNNVIQYTPDRYRDIRGLEIRFEKPVGRFVSFNAMYDYMIQSSGQSGLAAVYENRIIARDREIRSANLFTPEPQPRANVFLNLHTPHDFGPEWGGLHWLGGIYSNLFFEWRDGGRFLLNSEETLVSLQNWVDIVDYWNIDLRVGKSFLTSYGSIEFVLTVKNLTNNKWLNPGNMSTSQLSQYKNSLQTPDKGGDDKWGEYDKEHIDIGWWDAPIFLNPRKIVFGVRLNI
jgi:hypothetical protein